MQLSIKSAAIASISLLSLATIAQALPDQEMPKTGRPRSINWANGKAQLSTFPMPQRNKIQEESIDYRPKCYGTNNCFGDVIFQIYNSSGGQYEGGRLSSGHQLIEAFWGAEILADFKASKLANSSSVDGTKRWYKGSRYNYETWHYKGDTIVHFVVVSKQADQAKRMRAYNDCEKSRSGCGI
jgi:hypothetical protein